MKIIQLIDSLGNGGAEKFSVELCNELDGQGHEVELVSLFSVGENMLPPRKLADNVRLTSLNGKRKYSLTNLIHLYKLIGRSKAGVVHVHAAVVMLYVPFLIFSLPRTIKWVHTIHNTITAAYIKLFRWLGYFPLTKRIWHVCISEDIRNDYLRMFPKNNYIQIDNGVFPMYATEKEGDVGSEISVLKKNQLTKVFVAVGNYSVYKNFGALVRVFNRLEKEGHNVLLLIIGKPIQESPQWQEVQQIKGDAVFCLGLKDNVADYMSNAHALVISSTKEGMPLVALEALSLGVPVLATPAGGLVNVVRSQKNGFLTRGFSDEDLYQTVLHFLSLPEEKVLEMKQCCLQSFANSYSMQICAKKYDELYRQ